MSAQETSDTNEGRTARDRKSGPVRLALSKASARFRDMLGVARPRRAYRPDIDGVRALAVLAVVAYHYSPANFPGGFIGVDIFFVISGYLITGILVRGVEDREFANYGQLLSDFYQRRVRRIFPALVLVLAFCLIAGWLVLFGSEYLRLGGYVAAGAGYVENFVLWHESGYFDHAAISKPLLHLWSLAVEEQFYIFWPLMLWVVVRKRWPLLRSIALIAVLTFLLNVVLVFSGHTTQAFYSPISRAWELMAGAWLAVARRHGVRLDRWSGWQAWAGLWLIILGFVFIRPTSAFPGLWALLPVLGTALLVNAGPATLLNGFILSWRPAVWVGLISYPLYLWHWMLLSMTVTVFGEGSTAFRHGSRVVLFSVSVLLAWLTYRFVEGPIRRSRRLGTSIGLVAVVAVLGAAGLAVFLAAGLPNRPATLVSAKSQEYVDSVRMADLASSSACFNPQKRMTFLQRELHKDSLPAKWYCVLGDADSSDVVLMYGDSHARSLIPALEKYGRVTHTRIDFASIGSCLPLLGLEVRSSYPEACAELGKRMTRLASTVHPKAVVLATAWEAYLDPRMIRVPASSTPALEVGAALSRTLAAFDALRVPVLILEDNPIQRHGVPIAGIRFTPNPTDRALNASAISRAAYERQQAAVNSVIDQAASRYPSARVASPAQSLCNSVVCPWVRERNFLYSDDGHLSVFGAMQVYPVIASSLNEMTQRPD